MTKLFKWLFWLVRLSTAHRSISNKAVFNTSPTMLRWSRDAMKSSRWLANRAADQHTGQLKNKATNRSTNRKYKPKVVSFNGARNDTSLTCVECCGVKGSRLPFYLSWLLWFRVCFNENRSKTACIFYAATYFCQILFAYTRLYTYKSLSRFVGPLRCWNYRRKAN